MRRNRKILSVILSVVVLVTMTCGSFMFAGAKEVTGTPIAQQEDTVYGSMSILGDSIALGYDAMIAMEMDASDIYDIGGNAELNKFNWAYGAQVASRLGLDPKLNFRNFGICAVESGHILSYLTDPDAVYNYNTSIEEQKPYTYMTNTVKNSDLVVIAIGGNDLLQPILDYFIDLGNKNPIAGSLASLILQTTQDQDATEMVNDIAEETGIDTDVYTIENISDLINDITGYFSKENLNEVFKDTVAAYPGNIEGIITAVEGLNEDAQIAVMSQYNAYGVSNYFNMLAMHLENGVTQKKLTKNAEVLYELMMSVLEGVAENFELVQDMNKSEIKSEMKEAEENIEEAEAISIENLLSDDMTDLIMDLTFPIAVELLGVGFEDIYSNMNASLKTVCSSSDVPYVDISQCPTRGSLDPHPGEEGHAWIADKLYKTIVPQVTSSVTGGKGTVSLSGDKKNVEVDGNIAKTRLHKDLEYSIVPAEGYDISAVKVDGKAVSVSESGAFVLKDVTKNHKITVAFTKQDTSKSSEKTPSKVKPVPFTVFFEQVVTFLQNIFHI